MWSLVVFLRPCSGYLGTSTRTAGQRACGRARPRRQARSDSGIPGRTCGASADSDLRARYMQSDDWRTDATGLDLIAHAVARTIEERR